MICQRCRTLNAESITECVECGMDLGKTPPIPARVPTARKSIISKKSTSPLPGVTASPGLTCPFCRTPFILSWTRFLTSPWSIYQCPQCLNRLKLRDKGVWVGFIRILLVGIVTPPVGIGLMKYSNGDILISGIASLLVCCAICVPCDKYLNEHLRELTPLNSPSPAPPKN